VRTPEPPVLPAVGGWCSTGHALGECSGCADVVRYEPETLTPGWPLLCRDCGPAALGLAGF
jgi:hypothetical protein